MQCAGALNSWTVELGIFHLCSYLNGEKNSLVAYSRCTPLKYCYCVEATPTWNKPQEMRRDSLILSYRPEMTIVSWM